MSDFNPRQYLTKLSRRAKTPDGGWQTVDQDYLEVKWRVLWLRSEQPGAHVSTEIVTLREDFCCVRATVSVPEGGSATGIGSETAADWKDFIEKAETKALGRALAALGFGTQFCADYDFASVREDTVVDAPVTRPTEKLADVEVTRRPVPPKADRDLGNHLTEPQKRAIVAIGKQAKGWNEGEIDEWVMSRFGCLIDALSRSQASQAIDEMKLGVAS